MQRLLLRNLRNHRRERRRFAGAGRTGDEHEPIRNLRHLANGGRQFQSVDRQYLNGDAAKDRAYGAALHVDVRAKSRHTGNAVAEIDRLLRVEFFLLRAIEQRQKKAFEIGRLERLGLDRNKFPLHAH